MRLGAIIADYRYANRVGVREVAKEIGMSPATLNRIERGENFDAHTMIKLMAWLFAESIKREKRQK